MLEIPGTSVNITPVLSAVVERRETNMSQKKPVKVKLIME